MCYNFYYTAVILSTADQHQTESEDDTALTAAWVLWSYWAPACPPWRLQVVYTAQSDSLPRRTTTYTHTSINITTSLLHRL